MKHTYIFPAYIHLHSTYNLWSTFDVFDEGRGGKVYTFFFRIKRTRAPFYSISPPPSVCVHVCVGLFTHWNCEYFEFSIYKEKSICKYASETVYIFMCPKESYVSNSNFYFEDVNVIPSTPNQNLKNLHVKCFIFI